MICFLVSKGFGQERGKQRGRGVIEFLSLWAFLSALLNIYLGVNMIRADRNALANRLFFIICLGCSLWALTFMVGNYSPDKSVNWIAYKVSALVWCGIPGLFLQFILVLTRQRTPFPRWVVPAAAGAISSVFLYNAWFSVLLYSDFVRVPFGWIGVAPLRSPWPLLYSAYLFVSFATGVVMVIRWGKNAPDRRTRRQSGIIASTIATGVALSGMTDVVLPLLGFRELPSIGSLLFVIWTSGIWYASFKYRFLITSPSVVFDEVLSAIRDLLVFLGSNGAIVRVNAEMAEILGQPPEAIVGRRIESFLTPVDRFPDEKDPKLSANAALLDTSERQMSMHAHRRYLCKTFQGAEIPVTGYIASVNDRSGDPIGTILVARDFRPSLHLMREIDERERAEAGLAAARDNLEITVRERTSQLEEVNQDLREEIEERKRVEELLRQAQKMEVVGQLAGGIAHDLNNLLTPVRGYSDLIENACRKAAPDSPGKLDPGQMLRWATGICNSARRAVDLVQNLLIISRKGARQETTVDFHQLIDDIIGLLSQVIDRSIKVTRRTTTARSTIIADHSQMHSALLNLAINARDAMPCGGSLSFETDAIFPSQLPPDVFVKPALAGEYLRVQIRDTGIGMSDEIKRKLFEPFFTTKEPGHGTGLGLAGVYRTVVNSGGGIRVESAAGTGTCFTLYFPLAMDSVCGVAKSEQPGGRSSKKNILVVDDEELIREMLMDMLSEEGYSVVTKNDGREALDYFSNGFPAIDLVICDLNMPRMGGGEMIDQLRLLRPDLKFIVLTGCGVEEKISKVSALEGLRRLNKPFGVEALLSSVTQELS
jgi:PAS domain S-box-containing protein